jgi:PAS domain S-box-containing protein
MDSVMEVLDYTTIGVFAVLALVCLVRWRRWRAPGAVWVAASFTVMATVVVLGQVLPEEPHGILAWVQRASIAGLLLFPYFLYRFTASFHRPSRGVDLLALALTAVAVVWSLAVPIQAEGEPRSAAAQGFIAAVLVEWTVLSLIVAIRLWRAGRSEPTPGRRRLRLLSVASVALNITIVFAGTAPPDGAEVTSLVVQVSVLASILLFFVALFPPQWLRLAWRRPEEAEFRQAIGKLMTARRPEDVVASLLPHIRVVAGSGATLLDEHGRVIGSSEQTAGAKAHRPVEADGSSGKPEATSPEALRLSLRSGSLLVRPSPYTPFFGRDELVLLESLGALADLALERVEAEQTMRDQSTLLDLAPDAILARSMDGRINYWNEGATECYGFSQEEALGRVSHGLLATRFPAPLAEIEDRLLKAGRWEGELVQSRKDGSEVVVSSRWAVRTDAQGKPLQVLVSNTDVTEQKAAARDLHNAKEEAERANQAKSEFLSRMSHELRTPLNAILGFGQLLDMRELEDEERDSVGEIIKGGKHLLELINEVLEISRIEAGKLAISLEPVPVHDLVAETMSLIRPLAEQRGLSFRYEEVGCEGQHVLGDLQRLKQVLLNLLSNAVKYNSDGGSVHLRCGQSPAGTLRISVSDTGQGIPADRLDRLFEPFERLGAEQTHPEGTGLGLALSKRLVEAMGGVIGMEPAAGQGSVFWVELQQAEDPAERARVLENAAGPDDTPSRPRPSRTALYIEDNLSNLKLIQKVLTQRPEIRLIAAMHGRMGLDLARQHRPDVILLDLQLPDMSGGEILDALKADAATREIPVVVISADATRGQVGKLMAAGAQAYLTKPLDVQRFLEVLDGDGKDSN